MNSVRTIASAIVDLDRFLGIGVGATVGFGITWIALQGCMRQIGVAWLKSATIDALSCVPASECKTRALPTTSFTTFHIYSCIPSYGLDMPDKPQKRIPPWEQAQMNFQLAERKRLRQLEEKGRPGKLRLIDLEDNRRKLAEIRKNICKNCHRYIPSDKLPEGERKIGERFGFCHCDTPQTL